MNKLKQWLQKRRMRHSKELYNRGFNYAMGTLVRGEKTPLILDAERYEVSRDAFDNGEDAAMAKAIQLGIVKDDRMW